MNFIDAHIITHNFIDAVVNYMSEDSLLFLPQSKIQASIPEVYDAFIIFMGHSVFFDTRTHDELLKCVSLTRFIEYIVDDKIYNAVVSDNKLIYSSDKLSSVLKKKKINEAKNRQSVYTKLLAECMERCHRVSMRFSFNKCLTSLENKKSQLSARSHGNFSVDDIVEYINFVYSFSSQDANPREDYFYFTTFDSMRKDIQNGSKFYEHYKNYIMHAN